MKSWKKIGLLISSIIIVLVFSAAFLSYQFLKSKDFTAQNNKVTASKKKINDQLKNKANEKTKNEIFSKSSIT